MADGPVFTPASFNLAYRAFTPEQGNDVVRSTQKAGEVQNETASESNALFAVDTIAISPEATRMYADT